MPSTTVQKLTAFSQFTVVFAVLIHRALMIYLPFFDEVRHGPLLVNLTCGLLSDISLIFFVGALIAAAGALAAKFPQSRFCRGLIVFLGVALAVGMACHIRFVEHYGTTVGPLHLSLIETPTGMHIGVLFVLLSWRAQLVVWGAIAGALLCQRFLSLHRRRWSLPRWLPATAVFLLLGLMFHSLNLHFRHHRKLDSELKYNAFVALFFNYRADHRKENKTMPTLAQLAALRDVFKSYRQWDDLRMYPLWQKKIATGPAINPHFAQVRDELKKYLAEEERRHGPWNVLVVQTESLRAEELASFGNTNPATKDYTPNMDRTFAEGIRFTETIATGNMTHFGQQASLCSVYALPKPYIQPDMPLTNIVCLSDIFKHRGYETYFICGTNNHFNNRTTFHPYHNIDHLFGKNDFPEAMVRENWGINDADMFNHAVDTLKKAKQPFYASILTLSNHAPKRLPHNAPKFIDRDAFEREKINQYVDWAWGGFYERLKRELPHTLVVLVSDHGMWYDNKFPQVGTTYADIRVVHRIPFVIMTPGMPANLRGQVLNNLVSDVDVPPTILSLLGLGDVPNQFMGMDAFSRLDPILVAWRFHWRFVHPPAAGLVGKEQPVVDAQWFDDQTEHQWSSLVRFDLFGPPNYFARYLRKNKLN